MQKYVAKRFLKRLLGDYQYWKVYATSLPATHFELPIGITIEDISLKYLQKFSLANIDQDSYLGSGATGFVLLVHGEPAALLGVWWPERYQQEREERSWRIPENAVKTHGLVCLPRFRGKGYAAMLKKATHQILFDRGVKKVYCRMWHSHRDSINVSRKAGMKLVGLYIEICPLATRLELRIPVSRV